MPLSTSSLALSSTLTFSPMASRAAVADSWLSPVTSGTFISLGPLLMTRVTVSPFFTVSPAPGLMEMTLPISTVSLFSVSILVSSPSSFKVFSASVWSLFSTLGSSTSSLAIFPLLILHSMVLFLATFSPAEIFWYMIWPSSYLSELSSPAGL